MNRLEFSCFAVFVRIFETRKEYDFPASRRDYECHGAKDSILLFHRCPRIPSLAQAGELTTNMFVSWF
jgi:hypothetical protein